MIIRVEELVNFSEYCDKNSYYYEYCLSPPKT